MSNTKEGLQNQINKMGVFCDKWRLEINVKKTKIVVFNRGNKLLKDVFTYRDNTLENVKKIKYLGFCISAKNCDFAPTIDELSLKANRATFALNNKFKISRCPKKVAIKLFNTLIHQYYFMGLK